MLILRISGITIAMTELLLKGDDCDPTLPPVAEDAPAIEIQLDLFRRAARESSELKPPRVVPGPHLVKYEQIMRTIDDRLKEINPRCTPEYIMPPAYQARDIQTALGCFTMNEREAISEVRRQREQLLHDMQAEMRLELAEQYLAPDVLDTPPYYHQQDDWKNYDAQRACSNACFRMVFGAIAGWKPSEFAVARGVIESHGRSIVNDEAFYGIFSTDTFKEICDREVMTFEMMGTDFAQIQSLASKLKTRRDGREIFCVVNLASKKSHSAWHTSVLLGADGQNVTFHDPSNNLGGASLAEPYYEFADRWAVTYNRAVMVVADPPRA